MPEETRTVWSLYETKLLSADEASDPELEVFVTVEAEGGRFEALSAALEHAAALIEAEDWEVGVVVQSVDPPNPWLVSWLEPASDAERQEVRAGHRTGYKWVRSRPPRREEDQAVYEVDQLWKSSQGRRGYALEEETLELRDITRITLQFRERRIY